MWWCQIPMEKIMLAIVANWEYKTKNKYCSVAVTWTPRSFCEQYVSPTFPRKSLVPILMNNCIDAIAKCERIDAYYSPKFNVHHSLLKSLLEEPSETLGYIAPQFNKIPLVPQMSLFLNFKLKTNRNKQTYLYCQQ